MLKSSALALTEPEGEAPGGGASCVQEAVFELSPTTKRSSTWIEEPAVTGNTTLSSSILAKNILWFCRLRWFVVAFLATFGALAVASPGVLRITSTELILWPVVMAALLALANITFLWHAHSLVEDDGASLHLNLWAQIVADLVVLTAVIHYVGSLETPVAHAYLFHIVLACIFFSRRSSFAVTALSVVLFAGCVASEIYGLAPGAGIYSDGLLRARFAGSAWHTCVSVGATAGIWGIVWYLTSHLSEKVRRRDRDLAATNRHLEANQREKTAHLLRTTHELKAPFVAIHANAHLILEGHCGHVNDDALDVLRKIAARCDKLAVEIQQMLQISNLENVLPEELIREERDLAVAVEERLEALRLTAERRNVSFEPSLNTAFVTVVPDHLTMLINNLLGNAITYSRRGGKVKVSTDQGGDGETLLVIEDEGIGIPAEKLPRIFDEYYRTDEAARHNKHSTGLGLAIVRRVVASHGIRLEVASRHSKGTRFSLTFPPPGQHPQHENSERS